MDSESGPQTPGFNDDGGLWMKMDSNCVTNHTESPAESTEGNIQDEAYVLPAVPAAVSRYYGVMDDEGADDVFIPPPPLPPAPSDGGLLLPAGENMEETASNSLSDGAADATEPKANPSGLDRPHGEKQLTTATSQEEEDAAGTAHTAQESMDNKWLSEDCSPSTYKGAGCPMEQCQDADERHYQEDSSGNEDPNEDILILSEESEAKRDEYLEEMPLNNSKSESCASTKGGKTKREDICGYDETDSEVSKENLDIDTVETDDCSANDDGFKCSEQAEDKTERNNPQVDEDNEYVDSRSLDYNLTKHNWVRRESGSTDISEASEEIRTRREEGDGGGRITSDIQRGEQLLQRLQLLQLRHDVNMAESPREVDQEVRGQEKAELETDAGDLTEGGGNLTREEENDEEDELKLMEKEKNEKNGSKDVQEKTEPSCSAEPHQEIIVSTEAGDSDDQSDTCELLDFSPVSFHETTVEIPFVSTGHRLSVAETSIERQIHEEAQRKQSLQRVGGVFNLADDPDVLEIPFKTNVDLDSLPTVVGSGQRGGWQLSDHKMKKGISQEIQQEAVNQGNILGGSGRSQVRQMKETKLLFEAFQQDNTEGPTRYQKPPTSLSGGHIYPSVLERTRSLEMFSLKSVPVSRAHSLRLNKAATPDKSLENLRVKSPTAGLRDKIRLSPYSKQDKHHRLYKSMDSISNAALSAENMSKEDAVRQKSPILPQNPFFKLRPALALQPEVEKDIREAKEREEELRRQRCSLYGERKQHNEDKDRTLKLPDVRHQSRGKLERVWPPPSKKDQKKSEQQEPKVHRAGGQRAPLWQRWESGLINGQPAKEQK